MFKIFITKKEQAVNDFHHILILFSSEVKEITDQAPVQVHHYKQTVLMWVRFFLLKIHLLYECLSIGTCF